MDHSKPSSAASGESSDQEELDLVTSISKMKKIQAAEAKNIRFMKKSQRVQTIHKNDFDFIGKFEMSRYGKQFVSKFKELEEKVEKKRKDVAKTKKKLKKLEKKEKETGGIDISAEQDDYEDFVISSVAMNEGKHVLMYKFQFIQIVKLVTKTIGTADFIVPVGYLSNLIRMIHYKRDDIQLSINDMTSSINNVNDHVKKFKRMVDELDELYSEKLGPLSKKILETEVTEGGKLVHKTISSVMLHDLDKRVGDNIKLFRTIINRYEDKVIKMIEKKESLYSQLAKFKSETESLAPQDLVSKEKIDLINKFNAGLENVNVDHNLLSGKADVRITEYTKELNDLRETEEMVNMLPLEISNLHFGEGASNASPMSVGADFPHIKINNTPIRSYLNNYSLEYVIGHLLDFFDQYEVLWILHNKFRNYTINEMYENVKKNLVNLESIQWLYSGVSDIGDINLESSINQQYDKLEGAIDNTKNVMETMNKVVSGGSLDVVPRYFKRYEESAIKLRKKVDKYKESEKTAINSYIDIVNQFKNFIMFVRSINTDTPKVNQGKLEVLKSRPPSDKLQVQINNFELLLEEHKNRSFATQIEVDLYERYISNSKMVIERQEKSLSDNKKQLEIMKNSLSSLNKKANDLNKKVMMLKSSSKKPINSRYRSGVLGIG